MISVDQESMARQTEMDLMAADVERANSRVLEMERRNVGDDQYDTYNADWRDRRNYERRSSLYEMEVRTKPGRHH